MSLSSKTKVISAKDLASRSRDCLFVETAETDGQKGQHQKRQLRHWDGQPKEELENCQEFKLSFDIHQLTVELDLAAVGRLLKKAREIVNLAEPPAPFDDCRGICGWLNKVINQDKLSRFRSCQE